MKLLAKFIVIAIMLVVGVIYIFLHDSIFAVSEISYIAFYAGIGLVIFGGAWLYEIFMDEAELDVDALKE